MHLIFPKGDEIVNKSVFQYCTRGVIVQSAELMGISDL